MSVTAVKYVRRMRGGSNAQLMLADDGHYYVVKFRNNPQHPRILINELLCYMLLDYLQLPAPKWAIVNVPQQSVDEKPQLSLNSGSRACPCEPGLHLDSQYPGNPLRKAVYDYVPLSLLRTISNVEAFSGMVAFDKWVSNADGRQAIFFRERVKNQTANSGKGTKRGSSLVYVAKMIDHGFAFEAQSWQFQYSPERGLYSRREIYQRVTGYDSLEPWLSKIRDCPITILEDAYKQVPAEWVGESRSSLEELIETLHGRCERVPELVLDAKRSSRDPFPNWSPRTTPGLR